MKVKKVLFVLFILSCLGWIERYNIYSKVNEIFIYKGVDKLNLSKEEKLEEFQEFYQTCSNQIPSLSDSEKYFKTNFTKKEEYYKRRIVDTKDDFQYFCTMTAIAQDIVSFHTDIYFPRYSDYKQLNCYGEKELFCYTNLKGKTNYWYKTIGQYCDKYKNVKVSTFKYIEGEYYFDKLYSTNQNDYSGFHISEINNVNIHNYILNTISTYPLYYDSKRIRGYRNYLTFNKNFGDPVVIKLTNQKGDVKSINLCADLRIEMVDQVSYLYENSEEKNSVSYSNYYDDDYKIFYIKIKNFYNNDGRNIGELLKNATINNKVKTIIIDLRGNPGGYQHYASKYIYPNLYSDNLDFPIEWCVLKSKENREINNNIINRIIFKNKQEKNRIFYKKVINYEGKGFENNKKIIYLIDKGTGSAADGYVSFIKLNDLGEVIGTNTAGEGLGDSYMCRVLEYSGLVLIYYPSVAYSQGDRVISCIGTKPDYYIEQSYLSFCDQRRLQQQNLDVVNDYRIKLRYDNVLNEAIKIPQK